MSRVDPSPLVFSLSSHRHSYNKKKPAPSYERGDIEIKDYLSLSSDNERGHIEIILPRGEDDRFPPHTIVMDVTMTHDRRYGRTSQRTNGAIIHSVLHRWSSVWRCLEHCNQNKDTDLSSNIWGQDCREGSILTEELIWPESDLISFLVNYTFGQSLGFCSFNFSQNLCNEGYYSHRFVYVVYHTSTSFF